MSNFICPMLVVLSTGVSTTIDRQDPATFPDDVFMTQGCVESLLVWKEPSAPGGWAMAEFPPFEYTEELFPYTVNPAM